MTGVAVIGAQWGDEGKGKIVDWLTSRADAVVRFQGGHNAGHTLVIGEQVYKLNLMPSGIVRPGKRSFIGSGVVVDPVAFLEEIERVNGQGLDVGPHNLMLAENACLILSVHSAIDKAREAAAGAGKIGTTGRGIGPAYEDKAARRAIRVCDLADAPVLGAKVEKLMAHYNALLRGLGAAEIDPAVLLQQLQDLAPRILPYAGPVWLALDGLRRENKRILFEGAQGTMLDVDHGTYPFVTSSTIVAGNAASGAGVGPKAVNYVLGIAKAYTTRVGSGPFPTELTDAIGDRIGEVGREFGTVTGRKRRCGWFDAVMVRQACKLSGIDGIALTKLDVLDGIEEIKACVGYRLNGETLQHLPAGQSAQAAVEPIYESFAGWTESTRGARSWADLPANAVKYVRRLEELIETPVALLSTSPERDDTILMRDPFVA